MNVFEMFGFFMLGSFFNMIILLIFFMVIVKKIEKSLNASVRTIGASVALNMGKFEKIVDNLKGGKNGKSETMS